MTDAIGCPICRSEAAQIDRVPSMCPGPQGNLASGCEGIGGRQTFRSSRLTKCAETEPVWPIVNGC